LLLTAFGTFQSFGLLFWPQGIKPDFTSHLIPYDGCFYLSISDAGYHAGARECAFYPLWPLIIRWGSHLAGEGGLLTGLLLSNVFSAAAWLMFYRIAAERCGAAAAAWGVVLLATFPGSLFYQFLYSESLFFLLLMALCLALDNHHYRLAAALAFLLPLTRPIGAFCFVPILWQAVTVSPPKWLERWPSALALLTGTASANHGKATWQRWLPALTPFFGWLFYLYLMWCWTGHPLDGFVAQRYWGVHSIRNLWSVPTFVIGWLTPTTWHAYRGSLLDRSAFMILILCLPLAWRIDKRLIPWMYVLGVIPAMSGTFTSYTRFASLIFPMFLALGILVASPGRRWLGYCLLIAFTAIHVTLAWRYVNFKWAG